MVGLSERVAPLVTSESLMAHLATSVDDRPHVAPVWFDYMADRGVIEVLTTGRKLANIRENPRVALSIQKDEKGQAQWKVTAPGAATVVTDDGALRTATRRINRKYGADESAWLESGLVRISVGTVTVSEYRSRPVSRRCVSLATARQFGDGVSVGRRRVSLAVVEPPNLP